MANDPQIVKMPCIQCGGGPRNHDVVREYEQKWSQEDEEAAGEQGGVEYQICVCRGCDTVRFREVSWSTFDVDDWGNPETTVRVFPEAMASERAAIEVDGFPDKVGRIYIETVRALNAGALILAGGGLRAIVEAICIDQNVGGGNLQKRIDDLVAKGLLAGPQAELLHEERYIGNAALHEISPPAKADIEDGLQIVEGLLNTIYTLPGRAMRLRQKREKAQTGPAATIVKPPPGKS